MIKKIAVILALALALSACGGQEYQDTQDAIHGDPCQWEADWGECYMGEPFVNPQTKECGCFRTQEQCREACGTYPVSQYRAFECLCDVTSR